MVATDSYSGLNARLEVQGVSLEDLLIRRRELDEAVWRLAAGDRFEEQWGATACAVLKAALAETQLEIDAWIIGYDVGVMAVKRPRVRPRVARSRVPRELVSLFRGYPAADTASSPDTFETLLRSYWCGVMAGWRDVCAGEER